MRKKIIHTVTLLVADDKEAELAKKALDKYMLVGEGIISLDKDLSRGDVFKVAATKGFIKEKS